jgi:hypothetical protein
MAGFSYTEQALALQRRFDTLALTDDPAIVGQWPGAQFGVHVDITALITNCPRYIPRMQRLEGSRYVPDTTTGAQPIPGGRLGVMADIELRHGGSEAAKGRTEHPVLLDLRPIRGEPFTMLVGEDRSAAALFAR